MTSADALIDQAFTTLLDKANRQRIEAVDPPLTMPSVIVMNFDGGGQVLTPGLAGLVEVTFPCTILGCHIYAGIMTTTGPVPDVADASVYLGLATQGAWAVGNRPLYATAMPTITAAAEADVSVTGWTLDLQPGDLIPYGLVSFAGTATFLTVTLPIRRIDVSGLGISSLTSSTGNTIVSNAGNTVVKRNP